MLGGHRECQCQVEFRIIFGTSVWRAIFPRVRLFLKQLHGELVVVRDFSMGFFNQFLDSLLFVIIEKGKVEYWAFWV